MKCFRAAFAPILEILTWQGLSVFVSCYIIPYPPDVAVLLHKLSKISLFFYKCCKSLCYADSKMLFHTNLELYMLYFFVFHLETSESSIRRRWRRQQQPEHDELDELVPRPSQEGGEILCGFGQRRRRRHVRLNQPLITFKHTPPPPSPSVFPQTFVHFLFHFIFINGDVQWFLMCRCFTLFIIHIQVSFLMLIEMSRICPKAAFRSLERCALAHFNC